jgi:hypothetical protein
VGFNFQYGESPTAINIARVWIILAAVYELRARVARSEVRATIFVRDRIMVAAGCEVRARVTRSKVRANSFAGDFILVAVGVRGASVSCEVRAWSCESRGAMCVGIFLLGF